VAGPPTATSHTPRVTSRLSAATTTLARATRCRFTGPPCRLSQLHVPGRPQGRPPRPGVYGRPMSLEFRVAGLGREAVDYLAAWDLQREVHAEVVSGSRGDTVLLLEHPPVFTAGKRTDPHERPLDPGGAPVIDVDRGGK